MKQFNREHPHLSNITFAIALLAIGFAFGKPEQSSYYMWLGIYYTVIYAIARAIAKARFKSKTGAEYNKTLMEYYTDHDKQMAETTEITEVEKPREDYDDEDI